jgi:hypothetical protein
MCNAPVSEVQAKVIAPAQGILHTLMQAASDMFRMKLKIIYFILLSLSLSVNMLTAQKKSTFK